MGQREIRVGFRVDAGNRVGCGHLVEVFSIVASMRSMAKVIPVFYSVDDPFLRSRIEELPGAILRCLSDDPGSRLEADWLAKAYRDDGCVALVIDIRETSEEYCARLYETVGNTVVIVDTAEHAELPARTVINFAATQNPAFYEKARRFATTYLIGPSYFPVDPGIPSHPIEVRSKVETVFLNQGGSDPFALTAKILRALERSPLPQRVMVVVGGALMPNHLQELEAMKRGLRGNYEFHHNIPPSAMGAVMAASDMAVSAAGNTLYELAYMGVPTAVISHHERHDDVGREFARRGACVNIGVGTVISEEVMAEGIRVLIQDHERRTTLSRQCRQMIDGRGASRIAAEILRVASPGNGK